jgi:hypothetical protein
MTWLSKRTFPRLGVGDLAVEAEAKGNGNEDGEDAHVEEGDFALFDTSLDDLDCVYCAYFI